MKKTLFFCLILLLSAGACGKKQGQESDGPAAGNPLKEYINTPKEKARDARAAVEKKQEEVQEQFEETLDEDQGR